MLETLTKLVSAVIREFTSHNVLPSTAARAKVEITSIVSDSPGGLLSVIPNRLSKALTTSGSLVISGPNSTRVCASVVPGSRLVKC